MMIKDEKPRGNGGPDVPKPRTPSQSPWAPVQPTWGTVGGAGGKGAEEVEQVPTQRVARWITLQKPSPLQSIN